MEDEHHEHRKAFTRRQAKAALASMPEGQHKRLVFEAIDRAGFDPARQERMQDIMTRLGVEFSYEQLATILASIMQDMAPEAIDAFILAMRLLWEGRDNAW